MTKLFMANVSKHRHVFSYKLPEREQLMKQSIGPMSQVQIGGDMTPEEIAAILDMHTRVYGVMEWREARKSRKLVQLCYGIGEPVRLDIFFETRETNDAALNAISDQVHEESAVAMASKLESDLGKNVPHFEAETIEDKKIGIPKTSRGVEVVKEGVQPKHVGGNVVVRK